MLEGSDYFVHRLPFANRANGAAIVPNDDGTFDIYLNTLCDDSRLMRELQHELVHLSRDHFYSEEDIASIEREAIGAAL